MSVQFVRFTVAHYVAMYVADLAMIRSLIWTLALLVNAGILFSGYR
jgi:uncharacterized MAPEG superfamily protein